MAIMTSDNLITGKTMKGHTGSAYGLYSAMFFHPKRKIRDRCYKQWMQPGLYRWISNNDQENGEVFV